MKIKSLILSLLLACSATYAAGPTGPENGKIVLGRNRVVPRKGPAPSSFCKPEEVEKTIAPHSEVEIYIPNTDKDKMSESDVNLILKAISASKHIKKLTLNSDVALPDGFLQDLAELPSLKRLALHVPLKNTKGLDYLINLDALEIRLLNSIPSNPTPGVDYRPDLPFLSLLHPLKDLTLEAEYKGNPPAPKALEEFFGKLPALETLKAFQAHGAPSSHVETILKSLPSSFKSLSIKMDSVDFRPFIEYFKDNKSFEHLHLVMKGQNAFGALPGDPFHKQAASMILSGTRSLSLEGPEAILQLFKNAGDLSGAAVQKLALGLDIEHVKDTEFYSVITMFKIEDSLADIVLSAFEMPSLQTLNLNCKFSFSPFFINRLNARFQESLKPNSEKNYAFHFNSFEIDEFRSSADVPKLEEFVTFIFDKAPLTSFSLDGKFSSQPEVIKDVDKIFETLLRTHRTAENLTTLEIGGQFQKETLAKLFTNYNLENPAMLFQETSSGTLGHPNLNNLKHLNFRKIWFSNITDKDQKAFLADPTQSPLHLLKHFLPGHIKAQIAPPLTEAAAEGLVRRYLGIPEDIVISFGGFGG